MISCTHARINIFCVCHSFMNANSHRMECVRCPSFIYCHLLPYYHTFFVNNSPSNVTKYDFRVNDNCIPLWQVCHIAITHADDG